MSDLRNDFVKDWKAFYRNTKRRLPLIQVELMMMGKNGQISPEQAEEAVLALLTAKETIERAREQNSCVAAMSRSHSPPSTATSKPRRRLAGLYD